MRVRKFKEIFSEYFLTALLYNAIISYHGSGSSTVCGEVNAKRDTGTTFDE